MALTDAQLATFAAAFQAETDPTLVGYRDNGENDNVVNWYNDLANPAYYVFLSFLSTADVRKQLDYSEIVTGSPLAATERWAFDNLIADGGFNPSLENNREALNTIFSGASYVNTRTALLAAAVKSASRLEQMFSTTATGPGGGNGSAANAAAITSVTGSLTRDDVRKARELFV